MKELLLKTGSSSSRVLIGSDLPLVESFVNRSSAVVLADQRLRQARPDWETSLRTEWIEAGEDTKSLQFVAKLYEYFTKLGIDRTSTVIAVGGGALSDVVGFAAATFMRGIDLISIPTTLVSQVDACLGGKNGVNFGEVKNLIGTLHHPKLILCDLNWLISLPAQEFKQGLAELVKHGVISDPEFLDYLCENSRAILDRNLETLEQVVFRSLQIKSRFVEADEGDYEFRHALNFGHTTGHALERRFSLSHGDAVGLGMLLEVRLAERLGSLEPEVYQRVVDALERFGLPTSLQFNPEDLRSYLDRDKKGVADKIKLPILLALGKVGVRTISKTEILGNLAW